MVWRGRRNKNPRTKIKAQTNAVLGVAIFFWTLKLFGKIILVGKYTVLIVVPNPLRKLVTHRFHSWTDSPGAMF